MDSLFTGAKIQKGLAEVTSLNKENPSSASSAEVVDAFLQCLNEKKFPYDLFRTALTEFFPRENVPPISRILSIMDYGKLLTATASSLQSDGWYGGTEEEIKAAKSRPTHEGRIKFIFENSARIKSMDFALNVASGALYCIGDRIAEALDSTEIEKLPKQLETIEARLRIAARHFDFPNGNGYLWRELRSIAANLARGGIKKCEAASFQNLEAKRDQ